MGLSACVITLNEEANIERCLTSLSFADEIVVVDSFSTDRTVEIARRFTDRVVQREFSGFSDQKNAALEIAAQDWVLFVDADEVVTEQLAGAIRAAIADSTSSRGRGEATTGFAGYRIPRLTTFLGREMQHCGWYPDYVLRLARRDRARFPHRLVHETMEVDGPVGVLKPCLIHHSYPTLDDYARKMILYARAAARQKQLDGKRFKLSDLLVRPAFAFVRMYMWKQGFRDGVHGLVLSVLTACSTALRYAMLWELEKSAHGDSQTG
ncbi:MAG: glycosyltransferase family 2 protein [Armatimonadota bacterium]